MEHMARCASNPLRTPSKTYTLRLYTYKKEDTLALPPRRLGLDLPRPLAEFAEIVGPEALGDSRQARNGFLAVASALEAYIELWIEKGSFFPLALALEGLIRGFRRYDPLPCFLGFLQQCETSQSSSTVAGTPRAGTNWQSQDHAGHCGAAIRLL